MKNSLVGPLAVVAAFLLGACAPQREFVRFGDAGTFHPGPRNGLEGDGDNSEAEYESYELINHGAPNEGIPPMYSGQTPYPGGSYPAAGPVYDAYGSPDIIVVPPPW